MNYKYTVNGIDFIAKTKDIEKELKKLKFICEYRKESVAMLIVTIDSKEDIDEINSGFLKQLK